MRSKAMIERLKAQQEKNPDLPHYDNIPGGPWPLQPKDVKTAGYWKLVGRRPEKGVTATAFVTTGHGSTGRPTRWVEAYHVSQTVEIQRRPVASVKPAKTQREDSEAGKTATERWEALAELIERAPAGAQVLYLDSETTGLAPGCDELLEVAVVDEAGTVKLETLVKPRDCTEWPEAQQIHGIGPEDVAAAPYVEDIAQELAALIEAADALVIYNANFDLGFLPIAARKAAAGKTVCVMRAFSLWVGEWSDHHGGYRWHSLATAAARAGHQWTGTAHRAQADAQAARGVWQWLREARDNASN